MSAKTLLAQSPALAEADPVAPGLIDLVVNAAGGDHEFDRARVRQLIRLAALEAGLSPEEILKVLPPVH